MDHSIIQTFAGRLHEVCKHLDAPQMVRTRPRNRSIDRIVHTDFAAAELAVCATIATVVPDPPTEPQKLRITCAKRRTGGKEVHVDLPR